MAQAVLASRARAGGELLLVGLDVPSDLARSYVAPGQYVEVKTPRGNGYFVLAGRTGAPRWELLVRNAGDAADTLHTLPLGEPLEVLGPLGNGFPIASAQDRPVVVAVVGSALAVARPVMAHRIDAGLAGSTALYLGVRSARDIPLLDEVAAWADAGVHVFLCLSREEDGADMRVLPTATRARGYVQAELERAIHAGRVARRALVVAAGPSAMLAELRTLGEAHAVGHEIEVITNV